MQFLKGTDLLADLLPVADGIAVHDIKEEVLLGMLLLCNKEVGTVQGNPAVVTDDPSPSIGIREACYDTSVASHFHLRGIHVEDPVIMGLAVGEYFFDIFRKGLAIGIQLGVDQANASEGHDGAFKRLIGLQTDYFLEFFIDIALIVACDGRDGCFINAIHAPSLPLDGQ